MAKMYALARACLPHEELKAEWTSRSSCASLDGLDYAALYQDDFFLTWDKSHDEMRAVLAVADALRALREDNKSARIFDSGLGISLFRDNSTRTRFSYASACNLLGLEVQDLDEGKSQQAHGETVKETANMISFMADVIGIRDDMYIGKGHTYMTDFAQYLKEGHETGVLEQRPTVISLQCDIDHPSQSTADLLHLIHTFGGLENLRGKKLAMTWAYSPSYGKPLSVPQGMIGLMTRFGMDVTLAHPQGYDVMADTREIAAKNAAQSGGSFTMTHSMDEAFEGADIVCPKSWAPFQAMQERTDLYGNGDFDGITGAGAATPPAERRAQGLGHHRGDDGQDQGRQGALHAPAAGRHHRAVLRRGRGRPVGVRPLPRPALPAGQQQAVCHRRDDLPAEDQGPGRQAPRALGPRPAPLAGLTLAHSPSNTTYCGSPVRRIT